jgi:hypothetical protein
LKFQERFGGDRGATGDETEDGDDNQSRESAD